MRSGLPVAPKTEPQSPPKKEKHPDPDPASVAKSIEEGVMGGSDPFRNDFIQIPKRKTVAKA
jgi:hypothetical protein